MEPPAQGSPSEDETRPRNGPAPASPAALAFLASSPAPRSYRLTPETIDRYRTEIRAEFVPRAERALARFSPKLEHTEIGGIPCLEASPADGIADRTILYGYGGGYVSGSAFEDLIVTAALADLACARVITPEYRLAPEHPYPAAVDDGYAVYRAISREIPTGTLAIAGESAGGNLALTMLLRAKKDGLPMPGAVALLSPWSDLADRGDNPNADGPDPTLDAESLGDYAMLYAGEADLTDSDVSPVNGRFDGDFPPVLITSGTRDALMGQCVRLSQVLSDAGITVDLRIRDGLWHVFEFFDELPEARQSLQEISDFLVSHTGVAQRSSD